MEMKQGLDQVQIKHKETFNYFFSFFYCSRTLTQQIAWCWQKKMNDLTLNAVFNYSNFYSLFLLELFLIEIYLQTIYSVNFVLRHTTAQQKKRNF